MPPTIRGQTAGSSQYDGQGDPLSQPVPGSPRLARTRGLGGLVKLSLLLLGSSPLFLGHIFSGLLRVHLGPLRIRLGLTPVRRCQTEDLFEDVFAQIHAHHPCLGSEVADGPDPPTSSDSLRDSRILVSAIKLCIV